MFLMDTVFGHEQSIGMFNIELILIKKEKKNNDTQRCFLLSICTWTLL